MIRGRDRPRPGRPPAGRDGETRGAAAPARVACGGAALLVAAAGLMDELEGPRHWHGEIAPLRAAGGLAGAGVGIPLRAGLGVWGAGFVLLVLLVLALLIMTATPVREAAHRVSAALATAARALAATGRWAAAIFGRGRRRAAPARHPSAVDPARRRRLYDQGMKQPGGDHEAGAAAGADRRRGSGSGRRIWNRPIRGPGARTRSPAGPAHPCRSRAADHRSGAGQRAGHLAAATSRLAQALHGRSRSIAGRWRAWATRWRTPWRPTAWRPGW